MNEEPHESPISGPEEEDVEQSMETKTNKAENPPDAAPPRELSARIDTLNAKETPNVEESPDPQISDHAEDGSGEAKASGSEPPVDWFEPLEDDEEDANSWNYPGPGLYFNGRRDPDEESLAGESVKSESLARVYQ